MLGNDLVLYTQKGCPYCKDVVKFIKKNGLESKVKIVDVDSDPKLDAYLQKHCKENSVPCLFADGKVIADADNIIKFLGG